MRTLVGMNFAPGRAAVALRYRVRCMARSAEVADNMICAAVIAVMITGMSEHIPAFIVSVAALGMAVKHSKKLRKEE